MLYNEQAAGVIDMRGVFVSLVILFACRYNAHTNIRTSLRSFAC